MKYERYFQYTKGWTQIDLSEPKRYDTRIVDWCHRHASDRRFHLISRDANPYTWTAIRFESREDAMSFAFKFIE